jgi:hypothetical protein
MILYNCRYITAYCELFDVYENRLECLWNSGFYSNTHQTFSAILTLLAHGIIPETISYEYGFKSYKLNPSQDIYPLFHKPNPHQELPVWKNLYRIDANKTSGDYISLIPFDEYSQIISRYFSPSDTVISNVDYLKNKYAFNPEETICIFYRGTDKFTEVSVATPEDYVSVAKKLLEKNPNYRVLIQTDQTQALEYFLKEFGDRAFYFEELPTTNKTGDDAKKIDMEFFHKRFDYDENVDPVPFSQMFDAAIRLIASSKYPILHTGNGALFVYLYRGNANNVYQFNELGMLNQNDFI